MGSDPWYRAAVVMFAMIVVGIASSVLIGPLASYYLSPLFAPAVLAAPIVAGFVSGRTQVGRRSALGAVVGATFGTIAAWALVVGIARFEFAPSLDMVAAFSGWLVLGTIGGHVAGSLSSARGTST